MRTWRKSNNSPRPDSCSSTYTFDISTAWSGQARTQSPQPRQVELEEGARLTTNLVDGKLEDIEIGMPVEVVFDDVTGEITLPKFRPRAPG